MGADGEIVRRWPTWAAAFVPGEEVLLGVRPGRRHRADQGRQLEQGGEARQAVALLLHAGKFGRLAD
ncbi:hypothetical protein [Streptomyces sp. NPDC002328]|uniref:hypothetical protein n=1 Tax=Streptomyces sp. NPDC002328 TaxID=3364642 RepID=UPI0036C67B27